MPESNLSGKHGAYMEQFDVESLNFFRRLLSAIQNNEFVVYFQPKVNITDMKIAGAEALVRWNCEGRILPPVKFIPFCERTGLVIDIDFYVLEETCRRMRKWIDEGIEPVRISVNFSKFHFNEEGVAEKIFKVISKYRIPPELIEVEFTETAYLDKEELLEYTVDKLRKYGIKSSIDDFGSGYSSLNLLQNMDFEVVKLDKSLLGKGVENEKAKKVISSIIHMAKELEMEVLAEGVETKEELKLLQSLNCDFVQGFLFDKPLPAEEFEKRLLERTYRVNEESTSTDTNAASERRHMKLEDIDLTELKEKASDNEYENIYMGLSADELISRPSKKNKGFLIAGVILMCLAITVILVTLLFAYKSNKKEESETASTEEILYTQEEVDRIVEEEVNKAKEETEDQYKENIREAAEVSGGVVNFLRALFPEELVFIDGTKFKFVEIDRSLKQSTVEAARFVTDEETGFMYYTDESGNKTSYIGIDVSSFQSEVDWEKVKTSGIDFAIIRCGLRGYGSEGRLVMDSCFEDNIKGAIAAGLNVGVYFYTQALNTEEAIEEANFVLETISPYEFNGPIVLDVESASPEERIKDITATERTDNIIAFCDTIKAAGYNTMIYADLKFFTTKMEIARLEDYEKWYANYNTLEKDESTSVWGYHNPLLLPYEFSMWQYTNSGTLDGIEGDVDFDVLFEKWW